MRTLLASPLAATSAALLVAACSKPAPPLPCTSDLASIQRAVFAPTCATNGCHSANDAAGKLSLGAELSASQLVLTPSSACAGKVLVVPGAPEQSFLVEKITATPPSCGMHMPLGMQIPDEHKACIRAWIQGLPVDRR